MDKIQKPEKLTQWYGHPQVLEVGNRIYDKWEKYYEQEIKLRQEIINNLNEEINRLEKYNGEKKTKLDEKEKEIIKLKEDGLWLADQIDIVREQYSSAIVKLKNKNRGAGCPNCGKYNNNDNPLGACEHCGSNAC